VTKSVQLQHPCTKAYKTPQPSTNKTPQHAGCEQVTQKTKAKKPRRKRRRQTMRPQAPKMALHAGAVTAAQRNSTTAEQDPSEDGLGKDGTDVNSPSDPHGPQLQQMGKRGRRQLNRTQAPNNGAPHGSTRSCQTSPPPPRQDPPERPSEEPPYRPPVENPAQSRPHHTDRSARPKGGTPSRCLQRRRPEPNPTPNEAAKQGAPPRPAALPPRTTPDANQKPGMRLARPSRRAPIRKN
jgi:hypothetical protein